MLRIVPHSYTAAKAFNPTDPPQNLDPDRTYVAIAVTIVELVRGYINRMTSEGRDVPHFLWSIFYEASKAAERDSHP